MHTDLRVWLDHFEYHATRPSVLPERRPDDLTSYERRLLARSLAAIQRAESADSQFLLEAARDYEKAHNVAPLVHIVELLVAEEQHRAALLGAFMNQHGLARTPLNWVDGLVCTLYRRAGFELHIGMRVNERLIGKVYYQALEVATGCRQLQMLCRMLVADELAHIGFESDLLREMRARRPAFIRSLRAALHRAVFTSASVAAWFVHRRVLRSAGLRLGAFLRACATQYSFYLEAPAIAQKRARDSRAPAAQPLFRSAVATALIDR